MPVDRDSPMMLAPYEKADAYAVRAITEGHANEGQQRRGMAWIINTLACTYDLSYRPEKPLESAFAEGKRYVGMQIVKLANIRFARAQQEEEQP